MVKLEERKIIGCLLEELREGFRVWFKNLKKKIIQIDWMIFWKTSKCAIVMWSLYIYIYFKERSSKKPRQDIIINIFLKDIYI